MRALTTIVTLLLLTVLTACQTSSGGSLPEPQFSGAAYGIMASDLEVVEESTLSNTDPQVKYGAPTTLPQGIRLWAADRIRLHGTENRLQILIHDASLTESSLPKDETFSGNFKNEQTTKFSGKLSATIRLYTPGETLAAASAEMQASASTTIPENASLFDRQYAVSKVNNTLLAKLDEQFAQLIPQYFGPYMTPVGRAYQP